MLIRYFIFLLSISPLFLLAQFEPLSPKTIQSQGNQLEVHDFIQSVNGDLVLVGAEYRKRKKAKAVISIIKANDIGIETPKLQYVGAKKRYRQLLRQIVQLPDGGFFALGELQEKKKSAPKTWLVRFDEQGNDISPKTITYAEVYDYITPLGAGRFMLAKRKMSNGELDIRVVDDKGNFSQPSRRVKHDNATSIVGLVESENGTVTICGNAASGMPPWCKRVNAKGKVLQTKLLDSPPALEIEVMRPSYGGNITLAGKQKRDGDFTWVAELNQDLEIEEASIINQEGKTGLDIVRNPYDQYFLLDGYATHSGYSYEIQLHDNLKQATTPSNLVSFEDGFYAHQILYTYQHEYIVVGNVGKHVELRYFTSPIPDAISSKGIDDLKLEITALEFKDSDNDGLLSPGERAHLSLQIRNVSPFTLRNAIVYIKPLNNSNIKHFDKIYISRLKQGETIKRSIGLNGTEYLRRGLCNFQLTFEDVASKKSTDFDFSIEANGTRSDDDFIVEYEDANGNWKRINETIRSNEQTLKIRTRYQAIQNLKLEQFRLVINGSNLENQKDIIEFTTLSDKKYEVSYEIPLKQAINKIELFVKDGKYEEFFNFNVTRNVNLYVLAIAPDYHESSARLEWNDEDAAAFVKVMKQQDKGIFGSVDIEDLHETGSTTSTRIKIKFRGLAEELKRKGFSENDVLIIYFSGHGQMVKRQGESEEVFCLVPSDYQASSKEYTTVSYKEILEQIAPIECHKFVFLDACHSGSAKDLDSRRIFTAVDALHNAEKELISLVSSDIGLSYESDNLQLSYFTAAIVDAINGKGIPSSNREEFKCALQNGLITTNTLFSYIKKHMEYYTKLEGQSQVPKLRYSNDIIENGNLGLFYRLNNKN